MSAAEYAAWYAAGRGAWIGNTEFAILRDLVEPGTNESILDIGCGTGYFTSCFSRCTDARTVGLDPNTSWLHYAEAHAPSRIAWLAARAEELPFPDASFDITLSVTALCFIADQERALREIVRVTRRRFALGLLNRHSVLWRRKGRHGGTGGYRGARWHTVGEVRELLSSHRLRGLRIRSAVFLPGGGSVARFVESRLPDRLPLGAFLAVIGDV
jgi:SAM-dependent methyltransferase